MNQANERIRQYQLRDIRRSCTFETFLSTQPPSYEGSNDPTITEQWIQDMEVAFEVNECEEANKVVYAKRMLRGRAMAWCDTVMSPSITGAFDKLKWDDFLKNL